MPLPTSYGIYSFSIAKVLLFYTFKGEKEPKTTADGMVAVAAFPSQDKTRRDTRMKWNSLFPSYHLIYHVL